MLSIATHVRTELGLTQAEIAEAVGVSAFSVSAWESGLRRPREAHLWKALHALATTAYNQGRADLIALLLGPQHGEISAAWFPHVPPESITDDGADDREGIEDSI